MRTIECSGGGSYPYFSNRIETDMLMLLNQTISPENHLFRDSLKQEIVLPHTIYPQDKKDFKLVWEVLKKSSLMYYICKAPKNIPLQKSHQKFVSTKFRNARIEVLTAVATKVSICGVLCRVD
jgi:hypothetical protein